MHVDKQIKRIFGTYYQINNGNEYKKGKSFSLELSANSPKYGKVLSIVRKMNIAFYKYTMRNICYLINMSNTILTY